MADNTVLSIQRGCAFDLEVASIDPERCPSDEQCPKCKLCREHCKSGQQGGCGQLIQTNRGPMTSEQVFDFLSYRFYKFQRESHPRITAEMWKAHFAPADVDRWEARYLSELGLIDGLTAVVQSVGA